MQEYNKQASDNTSQEAQQAERDIEKAETSLAAARDRVQKFEAEIEAADARVDELNQELAGTQQAKEKQAQRAKLESRLSSLESERSKAQQRAQSWVHNFATAVLSEELVTETFTVVSAEETRGKIPAPYDEKIVNEILEDGVCICGTKVIRGTREYESIKALLNTAGDQTVMSRVISTNAALGRLQEKASTAWGAYERNQVELRRIESEIKVIEADILDISKELAANPITDIADKEAARERAKSQRNTAQRNKFEAQSAISGFERQRAEHIAHRDALVTKSNTARRFVKRARLAAALTARLSSRLSVEEELAREAIERDIDAIVRKFMRKSATVKLDHDYQLRLHDDRGMESAKSTGENQLLGLAFTGAIAKYAKERAGRVDDILLPGTVAPLVVDSPFGHLDPLYRRGVAEFLPSLASQVILLVSTSQASDAVMATLACKVGEEYILTRHNRSDGAQKQEEVVEIRGSTYELTRYNSEFNGTVIGWVRH
jgi:DNA sulfur modification protein DndD